MKKEDIIALPNEHLRTKSKKVHVVTDKIRALVDDMVSASLDWEDSRPHEISAALAAIQIDQPLRVVIVRSDFEDKDARDFTVLINPEIVKYEGKVVTDYEGCLSVNKVYGKVPRHTKIRVRAEDLDGKSLRFKADGFLARVIQHEIDHTKGILFVDHIKNDKEAFYTLDKKGELQSLDYDKDIAGHNLFED